MDGKLQLKKGEFKINNLLLFAEEKNSVGIEREGLDYKSCERESF